MSDFLAGLLPTAAMLGCAVFIALLFVFALRRLGKRKKRSPFTGLFLRGPGHTLSRQLDDALFDLLGLWMMALMLPLLTLSVFLSQAVFGGKVWSGATWWWLAIIICCCLIYIGMKTVRLVNRIQQLRLGHEGEVGVGQELNQLMAGGYRVYHDYPAEKFNIDHVVIGRSGVFAVETKARAKPDSGDGRMDARVEYDGSSLKFPGWTETAPLEQAARQAEWLHRWLNSAVGESVPVVAVVVIPGWYVHQTGKGDVLVFNGKRPELVFPKYRGRPLNDVLIQRVAHQVEAKCRDVTPRAYVEWKDQAKA